MCVIVDASLEGRFFRLDPELLPLWKWIDDGNAVLVVGGKLTRELFKNNRARDQIQTWLRAGLAHQVPPSDVATEASEIKGRCKSNDSHVIALARLSGARLLCACDSDLEDDFRNPALINKPRGSIYKRASHTSLLRHRRGCRFKAPRQ